MIIRASVLALASALCICAAAAQTVSGPVANGHRVQPIQQQIDRAQNERAGPRNRNVQADIDNLYDEIMRASAPPGRSSSQQQIEAAEIR